MSVLEKLHIGIVGACGRGASFKSTCDDVEVEIHAVCDTKSDELEEARQRLGAREAYDDFETMIERSDLDAVILGTPMPMHVPQAMIALAAGVHVLSEVPAGVNMLECRDLVQAANTSTAIYAMAENFIYSRPNAVVAEIVQQGLFGELYYGEGEYLHELKELNEKTPWRRTWQTGIDGVTYGTHSLGPLLEWMAGDRVTAVSCAGSGHHYVDPRGKHYEGEDTSLMLCRLRSGGLLRVRVDMLSNRPHAMTNYTLQGTTGCYESARRRGEKNWIWLASRSDDPNEWTDLEELEEEFLPDSWRLAGERAAAAGHGGGDYFEIVDFVEAVRGDHPPRVGIHEAMDFTLPGLVSQQSILQGGAWLEVPDSRQW